MIKIKDGTLIEESSKNQKTEDKKKDQSISVSSISRIYRPEVIDAKVYKLKSSFVMIFSFYHPQLCIRIIQESAPWRYLSIQKI